VAAKWREDAAAYDRAGPPCHATLLLQQGTHPKVLQRLGHSAIRTTMDIYSHVLLGLQEEAIWCLQERLSGTPNGLHTNPEGPDRPSR